MTAPRYVAPATKVFTRWHLQDPHTPPSPRTTEVTTRLGAPLDVPHPAATDGATRCGIPMLTTDTWTNGTPTANDPICSACADGTRHDDDPLW